MLYYKDQNNGVHAIESKEFEYLLPPKCVAISESEALSLRPQPTQAEIIRAYTAAIQKRLDDFAGTRGYDGILSAVTYAASTVPKFATEGQYAITARDATWAAGYAIFAAVEAGARPVPTLIELAAELPALAWPA